MIRVRPFLKWPGSKFRNIQAILAALPPGNRLIEPFMGSAAVCINSDYPHYFLSDSNKDLVCLFAFLQQEGLSFIHYCATFFTKENNCAEIFYQFRTEFNELAYSRRRAALFLYLNRHGFNGLCRYNLKEKFNVPFGRYVNPYFPHAEMLFFYEKSQKATITHYDFREAFALSEPGDIIYCDPPYVPLSQSAYFASYTARGFSLQDQEDLANLAMQYMKKKVTIIISNHDTDLTRNFYKQGIISSFPVKRLISGKVAGRKYVQELLAVFKD